LKDLPKTYIAVAGQDTLRDDGRLLKAALDNAGYEYFPSYSNYTDHLDRVPNIYDEYPGLPHWFWAFPSEHLVEPIAVYNKNLKKGFDFVLS